MTAAERDEVLESGEYFAQPIEKGSEKRQSRRGNEKRGVLWRLYFKVFDFQLLQSSQLVSVFTSVLYGFVAVVMGFSNKAVLNYWPYSNTLLTLQMGVSVIVLYIGRWFFKLNVRPFELKAARALVPVVFFYNANVGFALAGLKALNIPIFNTLKRMTPVMVLSAKFLRGDQPPSRPVLLSVLTIVSGCIVTGTGDMSFNTMGYLMALMSCCLQTTYLLLVERSGKEKGFNSNELLLYNAVLSLPVLLVLITVTGEVRSSLQALISLPEQYPEFSPLLFVALVMGSLLNYTLFLCTLCNSALTTTIVGALKGVVSTVLGFFLLGGVVATKQVVIGIVVNTLGGVGYTMAKYQSQKKRHGRNDISVILSSVGYGKGGNEAKLPSKKDLVFEMPVITQNSHMSSQPLQRKSPQHISPTCSPCPFAHVLVDIHVPKDPFSVNVR